MFGCFVSYDLVLFGIHFLHCWKILGYLIDLSEYQKALNSANYKDNLKYDNTILSKINQKQRKRDIIFFNLPFSLNVNSKIGKKFLNLITTSFDENHPYKKYLTATKLKYLTAAQAISKAK